MAVLQGNHDNEIFIFIARPFHVFDLTFWQVQLTILKDLIESREGDEIQICLWFAHFEGVSLCGRRGSAVGSRWWNVYCRWSSRPCLQFRILRQTTSASNRLDQSAGRLQTRNRRRKQNLTMKKQSILAHTTLLSPHLSRASKLRVWFFLFPSCLQRLGLSPRPPRRDEDRLTHTEPLAPPLELFPVTLTLKLPNHIDPTNTFHEHGSTNLPLRVLFKTDNGYPRDADSR